MADLNIKVILGSTRPKRFSEKAGAWIFEHVKKLGGVETELLDLRDYPLPFYNEPITPSGVKNGEYADPTARLWAQKIRDADAYVIVSPEYNRGTSGVLKNALDHVYAEWNNKPIGFVSYGSVGGGRAVEQLRLNSIELQMAPVRTAVHIPNPWTLVDENDKIKDGVLEPFNRSAETMLGQLVNWAKAFKTVRQ